MPRNMEAFVVAMSRTGRTKQLRMIVASCLVVVLLSCREASTESALAELRIADSLVSAAIAAKDAERTAAFYAVDAVLLPIAEPIVEGRAAIQEEWRHTFGIPGFSNTVRLVASDVSSAGDLGYTRGTYASPMLGPDGKQVVERGKWVSVWKRDASGNWRIVLDISNTDAPPPDHQESNAKRVVP
jgi:ketosteroid isomerase-like protein